MDRACHLHLRRQACSPSLAPCRRSLGSSPCCSRQANAARNARRARSSRPPAVRGVFATRGVVAAGPSRLDLLAGVRGRSLLAAGVAADGKSDGGRLPAGPSSLDLLAGVRSRSLLAAGVAADGKSDGRRLPTIRRRTSFSDCRRGVPGAGTVSVASPPRLSCWISARCSFSGLFRTACLSSSAAASVARIGPYTSPRGVLSWTE